MVKGERNHVKRKRDQVGGDIEDSRPRQKSRKGSKAWRKNIDIEEVTTGLDRVRKQKVLGGVIAEKTNKELFAVDTAGDHYALSRERIDRRLRADEILALKSAIAPVSGLAHKNSKLGDGIIHKKKKGALPPSELKRLKKIANKVPNAKNGTNAMASVDKETAKEYDVWDQIEAPHDPESWVKPVQPKKPPATIGKEPEKLTVGAPVPSIEVAVGGQSYNPPIDQWNELIEQKAQDQIKLDEIQQKNNARTNAAKAVDERFEEPLTASEGDDIETEEEIEGELISKPLARATAKTQAQRNRELKKQRQLAMEAAIKAKKEERKSFASLTSALATNTELSVSQKTDLLDSISSSTALRKHKFGKYAIPIDPLEIQLSDELAESLRLLKPEGNLFKDRFLSLVKRGIIESRVPQTKRRRYELLKKEKYSHKFDQGRPFMEHVL